MKKILALFLAMLLMFSLVACGGEDEGTDANEETNTAQEEQEPAGNPSDHYMEILKGGKYYMEYKAVMSYDGTETEIEAKVALDGEDMYIESAAEGINGKILILDGTMYLIDDASKQYMEMSAEAINEQEVLEAGEDVSFVESGKGDINGETLKYDKYTSRGEDMFFYFDGDDLKYIVSGSEGEQMVMEIIEFTDKIPDGLLELPKDYTKMG